MAQKALCIMAAGLGTRFGSLKQLHPLVNGFAILDFSIYDAIYAGFNEIILIVREEIRHEFKIHFLNFSCDTVKIRFVNQLLDSESLNIERTKPWGTGHALLTLEHIISNNFALINADDYYGRQAFQDMHDALYSKNNTNCYLIGYKLYKTLSVNGSVSRGECILDNNNNLKHITERHRIIQKNGICTYNNDSRIVDNTIVSMNFWGFVPNIFTIAKEAFQKFIQNSNHLESDEFYIASVVEDAIHQNNLKFKILNTDSQWYGITYKSDEDQIKKHFNNLIESNYYPKNLWRN
jgi:UTP-glucose-1-phosphate uridylyltransferase